MPFFQNSLHRWVSGGTLILFYASKIAEMNDSDKMFFKIYKNFKIGSVKKKLWYPKVGGKSKKSGKSSKFIAISQGLESETVLSSRIPEQSRKVFLKVVSQF